MAMGISELKRDLGAKRSLDDLSEIHQFLVSAHGLVPLSKTPLLLQDWSLVSPQICHSMTGSILSVAHWHPYAHWSTCRTPQPFSSSSLHWVSPRDHRRNCCLNVKYTRLTVSSSSLLICRHYGILSLQPHLYESISCRGCAQCGG